MVKRQDHLRIQCTQLPSSYLWLWETIRIISTVGTCICINWIRHTCTRQNVTEGAIMKQKILQRHLIRAAMMSNNVGRRVDKENKCDRIWNNNRLDIEIFPLWIQGLIMELNQNREVTILTVTSNIIIPLSNMFPYRNKHSPNLPFLRLHNSSALSMRSDLQYSLPNLVTVTFLWLLFVPFCKCRCTWLL